MDASPLGFPKGETPFLGLPAQVDLPFRIPGVGGGDALDRGEHRLGRRL